MTTIATQQIRELAQQLRVDSIRATSAAGSGHPTSALSAADLLAVLWAKHLRFDFDQPQHPNRDRLVFSKGHASPLLYALYRAAGIVSEAELMTLRQMGSRLEGHPVPRLPGIEVATGSLGQGLPIAVGMALAGKYLDRLPYRVWVLLGDSEMAEGSVWEALEKANYYKLTNLIGILDVNRLGQSRETEFGWNTEAYTLRARTLGWETVTVDGHDLEGIDQVLALAQGERDRPLLIVARTVKGCGVAAVENQNGRHGKALDDETMTTGIEKLGGVRHLQVKPQPPEEVAPAPQPAPTDIILPKYDAAMQVATRMAYGETLRALGARPDVLVLDAEVSNSTYSELFAEAYPDRYFEMWVAEQQMVAAAVGLATTGRVVFSSTFAAFLTRAYDFIRMAAVSRSNIRLCGSHAGVAIGEDGPSQMGLEDLSMMRSIHGSTVLYPCDGNQTAKLVRAMADQPGISYIRTTRGKTPIIYTPDEDFRPGGSKVVRSTGNDQVTLVGAGITLHEALKAADMLFDEGISVRVIDAYSIKPIDAETLRHAARETHGLVVSEDHWASGGLGDAVLEVFADEDIRPRVIKLAVREMPGSGTPEEQLDAVGIGCRHIVEAARRLIAVAAV